MANIYLRSTDGSDADSGASWALAKATIAGVAAASAAGDSVLVSQGHAEITNGGISIAYAGTAQNPVKIFGVNDSSEPPVSESSGGVISTGTGASAYISMHGSYHMRGLKLQVGVGNTNVGNFNCGNTGNYRINIEDSEIHIKNTNSTSRFFVGIAGSSAAAVRLQNVGLLFSHTSQCITSNQARFEWVGGSILSGSAAITTLFSAIGASAGAQGVVVLEDIDLSAISATANIVGATQGGPNTATLRRCKLPNSWTGSPASAVNAVGFRIDLRDCKSGSNKIRLFAQDYFGTVRDYVDTYRSGGASDGAGYAIKITTNEKASPAAGCYGDPIAFYNSTLTEITVRIEVLHDAQGAGGAGLLQSNEFGIRVSYPGGSVSSLPTNSLGTIGTLPTSEESWTAAGITTPTKQYASVTFTPSEAGEIVITPLLFTPSKSVFYCPKVSVA